jgi:hypothetical protein
LLEHAAESFHRESFFGHDVCRGSKLADRER